MTLSDVFIDPPSSDLWGTPLGLKEAAGKMLGLAFSDFDPCPFPRPFGYDGLSSVWGEVGDAIFVNPPFTKAKEFIEKAKQESKLGKTIAVLVASRTDTLAWHNHVFRDADAVYFIKGRLKFVDLSSKARELGLVLEDKTSVHKSTSLTAAFPSTLVVFRPLRTTDVCKAFSWDVKGV